MKIELSSKLKSKDAKVGVIGLGYVGLPLVLRFVDVGFSVTGFDTDEVKVSKLNEGMSYIEHIPSEKIKDLVDSNKFTSTVDFDKLNAMDAIIICVPTPLTEKREPRLDYVEITTERIAENLRPGQIISLESTTYPGTTEEIMKPKLEESGLKAGKDFCVAVSPELIDPGN